MKLIIPAGARAAAHFGDWTLYERPTSYHPSILWLAFKLMLPESAPRHWGRFRAFRLHWNVAEARLRRDQDGARLRSQEPALYAALEAFLAATYTRAWLLEAEGVTAAEIDAEVTRLASGRGRTAGA